MANRNRKVSIRRILPQGDEDYRVIAELLVKAADGSATDNDRGEMQAWANTLFIGIGESEKVRSHG